LLSFVGFDTPSLTGSRRATPTSQFQQQPGHPRDNIGSLVCSGTALKAASAIGTDFNTSAPNLIIDSDLGDDQGDAGAFALLHSLADGGEVNILATMQDTSRTNNACAEQAINTYYGRATIPVGTLKDTNILNPDNYGTNLATNFPNTLCSSGRTIPNAVTLYRQVLASQPDNSVSIVTIGMLRNIYNLYNSPADSISPLSGSQLILKKVKLIVVMGGDYPVGHEYNFYTDPTGASVLNSLANTMLKIVYVGFTLGNAVTDNLTNSPLSSPVRAAYVADYSLTRPAWDELAIFYAVRGLSSDAGNFFSASGAGFNNVNGSGNNTFTLSASSNQFYLSLATTTSAAENAIISLTTKSPQLNATTPWTYSGNTLYFNSGHIGIGAMTPGTTTLQVVDAAINNNVMTPGTASGVFSILSYHKAYGLFAGVKDDTGDAWIQVGRSDGMATAYNLLLQTGGGNVGIGTTNPSDKLEIVGTKTSIGSYNNGILTVTDNSAVAANIGGAIAFKSNYTGTTPTVGASIAEYKLNAADGDYSFGLQFSTRNSGSGPATRMTIDNLGNVGVAQTSPTYKLDVTGNGRFTTFVDARNFVATSTSVASTFAYNVGIGTTTPWAKLSVAALSNNTAPLFTISTSTASATSTAFIIDKNGLVGIGTSSPTTALQVNGSITPNIDNTYTDGNATYRWSAVYSANGTIQTSDQRLKNNITDLNYGLPDLLKLRPVSFTWVAQPQQGTQLGFIAQEVQPIFPETVNVGDDANHTLGLTYTEFIPIVVKSIQQIASISGVFEANLIAWLGNASNGITDVFANNIHAQNQLCVGSTCINQQQLAGLLALETQQGQVQISAPTPLVISGTSTPPSINIQGSNPATINVGDTYTDLGAIVHDNQGHDLSYRTFVNGVLSGNILIDTSQVATDTIDYVATDTWGNTGTGTRTVIVQTASSSPSLQ